MNRDTFLMSFQNPLWTWKLLGSSWRISRISQQQLSAKAASDNPSFTVPELTSGKIILHPFFYHLKANVVANGMHMVGQRAWNEKGSFYGLGDLRQNFIWASSAATRLDDMKCGLENTEIALSGSQSALTLQSRTLSLRSAERLQKFTGQLSFLGIKANKAKAFILIKHQCF